MFGPGSANASAWSQYPATSTVSCGSNAITTTGAVSAGSVVANSNLSLTHDATNGGKIMTTSVSNLGIGTSGLTNSVQISASGNVGILKAPSVALDVNGQVSSSSVTTGTLALSGDATTKNINPITNNTYYCGDPSYRWANTYSQGLDVAGIACVGTTVATSNAQLTVGGTGVIGCAGTGGKAAYKFRNTTSDHYQLEYNYGSGTRATLDIRMVGESDGGTPRMFDFGNYTSSDRTNTWNSRFTVNSYNGQISMTSPAECLFTMTPAVGSNSGIKFAHQTVPTATSYITNVGTSGLYFNAGGADRLYILSTGTVSVPGTFSAGTKSFKISHPLPSKEETHYLVHNCIEAPQADLHYRGKTHLVEGKAVINIDLVSGMTEGTFVALCRDVQCFTSNESDWIHVRGKVEGNILTIEAQDTTASSLISWLVVAERKDKLMYESDFTDDDGHLIVEPLRGGKIDGKKLTSPGAIRG